MAASKSWGGNDHTFRIMASALLTSKFMYGLNYLRLTKMKKQSLEYLNRAAMQVVTRLPRFDTIQNLDMHSRMNILEDRVEAQNLRLDETE